MLELDKIYNMDCRYGLRELDENSIDAVVTDPPYELGFMGKQWDGTGIAYNTCMWQSVLRALKPGGHLLSFGGSRTYHRMACAIEDAGFEIRDQIMWVYGSGFPKSLNIGKAIDKLQGTEREILSEQKRKGRSAGILGKETDIIHINDKGYSEWEGWGTALKPAHEPIVLARKPLSEKTVALNVLRWGVGGLNIDGCRIPLNGNDYKGFGGGGVHGIGEKIDNKVYGEYAGRCDINHSVGRFPANLIHDGSPEVTELFPNTVSNWGKQGEDNNSNFVFSQFGLGKKGNKYLKQSENYIGDSGSAARFFYCAKASKTERDIGMDGSTEHKIVTFATANGTSGKPSSLSEGRNTAYKNNHPTVKPLSLMEYLIKLITRENQIVLDPFIGSGTTAIACKQLSRRFIGFEISPEYCKIAERRVSGVKTIQKHVIEEKIK